MIEIDIDADLKMAALVLAGAPRTFPRAAARAINRAATSARAEAVRAIRSVYTAKAGRIRRRTRLERARPSDMQAAVVFSGPAESLIKTYSARFPASTGPATAVQRGKWVRHGGAFRATAGKYDGIFFRPRRDQLKIGPKREALKYSKITGRVHRLPVQALKGPSIPALMRTASVSSRVRDYAVDQATARIDHEVGRMLDDL